MKNILFLDTFDNVKMFRNLSDILESVWIVKDGFWENVTQFQGIRFSPYYPGIRAELDLSQYLRNTKVVEIYFLFNKKQAQNLCIAA